VCLAFLTGNKAVVMPNPLMEEERFVRGAALKLALLVFLAPYYDFVYQ